MSKIKRKPDQTISPTSKPLPIYKRPEYRALCFLSDTANQWIKINLSSDMRQALKKPLTE